MPGDQNGISVLGGGGRFRMDVQGRQSSSRYGVAPLSELCSEPHLRRSSLTDHG